MSADRSVSVGEYGRSKIRCDGFTDGRRCTDEVVGAFRRGIADARNKATERGWVTAARTQYAPNGFELRDYCPIHTPVGRKLSERDIDRIQSRLIDWLVQDDCTDEEGREARLLAHKMSRNLAPVIERMIEERTDQ